MGEAASGRGPCIHTVNAASPHIAEITPAATTALAADASPSSHSHQMASNPAAATAAGWVILPVRSFSSPSTSFVAACPAAAETPPALSPVDRVVEGGGSRRIPERWRLRTNAVSARWISTPSLRWPLTHDDSEGVRLICAGLSRAGPAAVRRTRVEMGRGIRCDSGAEWASGAACEQPLLPLFTPKDDANHEVAGWRGAINGTRSMFSRLEYIDTTHSQRIDPVSIWVA